MSKLIRDHIHIDEKTKEKAKQLAEHYYGNNKSLVYREAIERGLDVLIKEKTRG